CMICHNNAYIF
nr:immunoglobulin light chain junction region [Macaca mulatta]MPO04190.1 immunoglobulin light chain junction region [Macaca mulatta]MPO06352.1 immunoglobulin light chain junction region [Macaca mulatta]MPO06513.1 immunoglobulin light chain junction region [Macaca mulatta]MPO07455.1 immunoglobulin light chain junction region [Macaca mulatta]